MCSKHVFRYPGCCTSRSQFALLVLQSIISLWQREKGKMEINWETKECFNSLNYLVDGWSKNRTVAIQTLRSFSAPFPEYDTVTCFT